MTRYTHRQRKYYEANKEVIMEKQRAYRQLKKNVIIDKDEEPDQLPMGNLSISITAPDDVIINGNEESDQPHFWNPSISPTESKGVIIIPPPPPAPEEEVIPPAPEVVIPPEPRPKPERESVTIKETHEERETYIENLITQITEGTQLTQTNKPQPLFWKVLSLDDEYCEIEQYKSQVSRSDNYHTSFFLESNNIYVFLPLKYLYNFKIFDGGVKVLQNSPVGSKIIRRVKK
jgi:hypothetical protein